MIDVGLMDLIRQVLEVSTADVNDAREALLVEQRSADARYAASSALVHPEGSTTPINEAYSRAQDRVANLRAKALKELPAAYKLLLALQVAEERRAEALKHRDMKLDQAFAKDTLGVDPAVADWFARLHNHGVYPHHLKAQAAEMVAIIADLVTWKAKDALFRDPDNPWRTILQVYASRRIEKPLSKRSKARRSVPGTPTRDRHISDLGDYMFNEMVNDAWFNAAPAAEAIEQQHEADARDERGDEGAPEEDAHLEWEGLPASNDTIDDQITDEMPLSLEQAAAFAETIVDNDPFRLSIYWPKEVEQGDYDSGKLIPALERWIASGETWTGPAEFLVAAREGQAREFIAGRRQSQIRHTAQRLLAGDEKAFADARRAGLRVPIGGDPAPLPHFS